MYRAMTSVRWFACLRITYIFLAIFPVILLFTTFNSFEDVPEVPVKHSAPETESQTTEHATTTTLNVETPKGEAEPEKIVVEEQDPHLQQALPSKSNKQIWEELEELLHLGKPSASPLKKSKELPSYAEVLRNVPDCILMDDEAVFALRYAHEIYVRAINDTKLEFNYQKGSRGIVTAAPESFFPGLLVTLRMLRRNGSKLPVEVFVSEDEALKGEICQKIFPVLNARCIDTVTEIGDIPVPEVYGNRYFHKIFAMIFSTFDEFMFLDADNVPVENVDNFFTSVPFTKTGLVAWPDFYPHTGNPKLPAIVYPTRKPIAGTVESGQLLLSKSKHNLTLLLALYYNYYGPKYYYLLMSQGAYGSGDKETYVNAALALDLPFYVVKETVMTLGGIDHGGFKAPAMLQFDPIIDYGTTPQMVHKAKSKEIDLLQMLHAINDGTEEYINPNATIAFVHHNTFKLRPDMLFEEGTMTREHHGEGKYRRIWGSRENTLKRFRGIDMEYVLWEEIKAMSCVLRDMGLVEGEATDACQQVEEYIKEVFLDEEESEREES